MVKRKVLNFYSIVPPGRPGACAVESWRRLQRRRGARSHSVYSPNLREEDQALMEPASEACSEQAASFDAALAEGGAAEREAAYAELEQTVRESAAER